MFDRVFFSRPQRVLLSLCSHYLSLSSRTHLSHSLCPTHTLPLSQPLSRCATQKLFFMHHVYVWVRMGVSACQLYTHMSSLSFTYTHTQAHSRWRGLKNAWKQSERLRTANGVHIRIKGRLEAGKDNNRLQHFQLRTFAQLWEKPNKVKHPTKVIL